MKRGTEQLTAMVFSAAHEKIAEAMRATLDGASPAWLEATAIGAIAVALAFSPISDADMDGFTEHLPDMVSDIRAWYGIGGVRH